jgi:hypothetical protein
MHSIEAGIIIMVTALSKKAIIPNAFNLELESNVADFRALQNANDSGQIISTEGGI